MSAPMDAEGVWIRFCNEHQWLSPTFYRYADVVASHGADGHNRGTGCLGRCVGRLEVGTAAAVLAQRLPDWAQGTYWARKGEQFFAAELGERS